MVKMTAQLGTLHFSAQKCVVALDEVGAERRCLSPCRDSEADAEDMLEAER